jgi:hypothetical protein
MTERAEQFMKAIWDAREQGADTEEKLVAFILRSGAEYIKSYTAQNELIVLCRNDMVELANEVEGLK